MLARETTGLEKVEATERLVVSSEFELLGLKFFQVSLGGLPSKKKVVNYKLFQENLKRQKEEAKEKEITFAPNRVIKKKSKK